MKLNDYNQIFLLILGWIFLILGFLHNNINTEGIGGIFCGIQILLKNIDELLKIRKD